MDACRLACRFCSENGKIQVADKLIDIIVDRGNKLIGIFLGNKLLDDRLQFANLCISRLNRLLPSTQQEGLAFFDHMLGNHLVDFRLQDGSSRQFVDRCNLHGDVDSQSIIALLRQSFRFRDQSIGLFETRCKVLCNSLPLRGEFGRATLFQSSRPTEPTWFDSDPCNSVFSCCKEDCMP